MSNRFCPCLLAGESHWPPEAPRTCSNNCRPWLASSLLSLLPRTLHPVPMLSPPQRPSGLPYLIVPITHSPSHPSHHRQAEFLKKMKLYEMLDLNHVCWLQFIHSSLHFIPNFNLSLCLILGFSSCPFLSSQILNSQSSGIFKKAQQKLQFIWTLWTFSLNPDLINIFETTAGIRLLESETSNIFVTFKLGN